MASPAIAVVTGSNKGIGYAIVRGLMEKFNGIIYLTSRNESLGNEAIEKLKGEVPKPVSKELRYHQLDITDEGSVTRFADYLKKEHGGLDILINNAGIAYKSASTAPFAEQATETNKINYFGTLQACRKLFPILRPHARVVNVSSRAGLLGQLKSEELKKKFLSDSLTMDQLTAIVEDFVKKACNGTHADAGYSNSSYGMSKIAVTAMTRILQRELAGDPREDIVVTACCPGYVDTDMTSHKGSKTIDEGADTPLYLAFLPRGWNEGKGRFFAEKKEHEWDGVMKF